jgi:predicted amidohydrolase
MKRICLAAMACCLFLLAAGAVEFDGWVPIAPREELRPEFDVIADGGPDGQGGLVVQHGPRTGLDGAWTKTFPVDGGQNYRIEAHARLSGVSNPRAHVYVELTYLNAKGGLAFDETTGLSTRPFFAPETGADGAWRRFSEVYRAPADAALAEVRLQLRWEPNARIEWGGVSLAKSAPRTPRIVRLAAANYRPGGGATAMDNLRQLAGPVAEAAEQRADLVVLGECINSVGTPLSYEDVAETIPGPSTDFLGELAAEHGVYIVATIHERSEHLIYNTAVLLGPDGALVGRYRKICLARDEYRRGVAPGNEFPVFETPIGKIGMMICFDVHMPEVARGLAANGAEIIAMPIMGGHPDLARARAIENQVYLVSSTYGINDDWMQSGVWGLDGSLLVRATERDSVVVAEIDLAAQHIWRENMGDFKGRLRHERPAIQLPE